MKNGDNIEQAVYRIAAAITPDIGGGKDEAGGYVSSLTEAIMGMTTGLCKIAEAIERLADAAEERNLND